MPILIDFFNIFIVGIAENIIELYFFAKLNGKKAKLSHYILLSAINNSFVNLVPAALPAKLLINAVLLVFFGVFIYKAGIKTAVLYTIIIVEVMELCFGIFNSLTGILSPLLYPVNPKAVGLIFMIINSFCSLLLSCLCYSVIHKYFVYSETEKNRYILMLFMPLLMILMLSEFISNSVYSNTIVLSRRGEKTQYKPSTDACHSRLRYFKPVLHYLCLPKIDSQFQNQYAAVYAGAGKPPSEAVCIRSKIKV